MAKHDREPAGEQTAGICIDDWKLPTFERCLSGAGYQYETHPGITHDTLTLKVKFTDVLALKSVVEKAQKECRK